MIATPTPIKTFQTLGKTSVRNHSGSLKEDLARNFPDHFSASISEEFVRSGLRQSWEQVAPGQAIPGDLEGSLFRPWTTLLSHQLLQMNHSSRQSQQHAQIWFASLGIELAHQASLIHDDAIEKAMVRRGKPTPYSQHGIGGAILEGDRVLGLGYQTVSKAENHTLQHLYNRSILKVIEGEEQQARWRDKAVPFPTYINTLHKKTGSLFGFSFAAPFVLTRQSRWRAALLFGHRLGVLYQLLDDILDYCPWMSTGKPPLQDFRQHKWTLPLYHISQWSFEAEQDHILSRLLDRPTGGRSALENVVQEWRAQAFQWKKKASRLFGNMDSFDKMLNPWDDKLSLALSKARTQLVRGGSLDTTPTTGPGQHSSTLPEKTALESFPEDLTRIAKLSRGKELLDFWAKNSRSFRFASRFMPRDKMDILGDVYVFCRLTDDLADGYGTQPVARRKLWLQHWRSLAWGAYRGNPSGFPLIDRLMAETASQQTPFQYVDGLIDGVSMDLNPRPYRDMKELRRYTHGVASVVGQWLTEMCGVHDQWILERAGHLGHAMQLTNILRDVGEDWRNQRFYLPLDSVTRWGLTPEAIGKMVESDQAPSKAYQNLVEEIIAEAEASYHFAMVGVPSLPTYFRAPVTIAAYVYRAILYRVRGQRYSLKKRAVTTKLRKLIELARALVALRRMERLAQSYSQEQTL